MNKENQQLVYFEPDTANAFPFTSQVECYLGGVGQLVFGDGTFQFAENKTFPEIVYSPRLTEIEMESFCKENISFYEKYFNENRDAIDLGDDLPPIVRFWECPESKSNNNNGSSVSGSPVLEERSFSVHTNLIWELIFKQHHSVTSALQELIQNAYDAKAGNVWLTVSSDGFECIDDGNGFANKAEITEWFEVFGAPRDSESDFKFGRFRMGRGQIMGLASTEWRSAEFQMSVDAKNKGLDYILHHGLPLKKGCTITGTWYNKIDLEKKKWNDETELDNLISSLSNSVRYIFSMNVFLNGQLISTRAEDINWTIETDDFYFLRKNEIHYSGRQSVSIYNLGIFIDRFEGMRDNGVVVTKKHLKLNITRSKVQPDCPIFNAIRERLRQQKYSISQSKKFRPDEARIIFERYCANDYSLDDIKGAKLISDLHGRRFVSLEELSTRMFTIPYGADRSQSDLVDQIGKYFVVNIHCLPFTVNEQTRKSEMPLFSSVSRDDKELGELIYGNNYSFKSIIETVDTEKIILTDEQLSKKEQQILMALNSIKLRGRRKCVLGISSNANGWTDGHSFIAIERNWLKSIGNGLAMVMELTNLLIHEYSHTVGQTEDHDGAFYKKYHDTTRKLQFHLMSNFLRAYDDILASSGSKTTEQMMRAIQVVRRGGKAKISGDNVINDALNENP